MAGFLHYECFIACGMSLHTEELNLTDYKERTRSSLPLNKLEKRLTICGLQFILFRLTVYSPLYWGGRGEEKKKVTKIDKLKFEYRQKFQYL